MGSTRQRRRGAGRGRGAAAPGASTRWSIWRRVCRARRSGSRSALADLCRGRRSTTCRPPRCSTPCWRARRSAAPRPRWARCATAPTPWCCGTWTPRAIRVSPSATPSSPIGLDVPDGRRGRRVISVTVRASSRGPTPITTCRCRPATRWRQLEVLAALLTGATSRTGAGPAWAVASALADVLLQGRYVAVLADAEPSARTAGPPPARGRAAALWRLSHALNDRTRGAVIALRAGGNRTGAESVMTAAGRLSDGRGLRRRRAPLSAARRHGVDLVDAARSTRCSSSAMPRALDTDLLARIGAVATAVIGPGASDGPAGQGPRGHRHARVRACTKPAPRCASTRCRCRCAGS